MVSYQDIQQELESLGLTLRGGFVDDETYVLIGNVGSKVWEHFGIQYDDWIEPDPLDNWTKASLDPIAGKFGAKVIYPFNGDAPAPFQTWAMKGDCVFPTPIGALIHPQYGLWHAYRACFIFDGEVENLPQKPDVGSPCATCETKPCQYSCPVDAYKNSHFNFMKCIDFLNKNLEGSCMKNGCLARKACPVGSDYAYEREHGKFHMDRFLTAMNP